MLFYNFRQLSFSLCLYFGSFSSVSSCIRTGLSVSSCHLSECFYRRMFFEFSRLSDAGSVNDGKVDRKWENPNIPIQK